MHGTHQVAVAGSERALVGARVDEVQRALFVHRGCDCGDVGDEERVERGDRSLVEHDGPLERHARQEGEDARARDRQEGDAQGWR